MIEAVLFDIDGTLVDSVDFHTQAWQETFAHFGHEVPFCDVRSQIGKGGDQLMPVFLPAEQIERQGKEIEEFRSDLFKREYLPRVKAFPSVRELFERILADGKKIGLASSAKGDELETYKKLAGITDLIHSESSSDDAEKSKPNPDIFQAAMASLGGPRPDRVIVVGDSPFDAEAAKRASIATVGVLSGGFPEDVLRNAGCVAIFRDPADLLNRYEESPIAR